MAARVKGVRRGFEDTVKGAREYMDGWGEVLRTASTREGLTDK
jgi:hypothetical protein